MQQSSDKRESAAELRGVSKYYSPTVAALKSLDLSVARNEFLTVLGPSGSGKSTLLSLLAGFERATDGRVIIAGRDVTNVPAHRRNVGMVFQDYVLFPHMSVFDNVYFPLKARKIRPSRGRGLADRVKSVLKTVGLEGYEDRRPNQLSGGQQQRVAVARALVYGPEVLLMDEPLSSLDRKLRKQLQGELINLHRTVDTTIIFVTHDQEEAISLSDRIAILSNGEVQQIGSPSDLYHNPQSLFVATFIGDANIFAGSATSSGVRLQAMAAEVIAAHDLRDGEPASVVVRPESVRLEPVNGTTANGIVGTVTHLSFRGSHLDASVELVDGMVGTAMISPHEASDVVPGSRVRLKWAPGSEEWSRASPTREGSEMTASRIVTGGFRALRHRKPGVLLS